MQALIVTATGALVAYGLFPTPPEDPAQSVVDVPDDQAALLSQPGTKTVAADGTISVDTAGYEAAQAAAEEVAAAAATQQAADQQAVIAGLTALGQPDAAAALARLLGSG